jgi:hypothetical protein
VAPLKVAIGEQGHLHAAREARSGYLATAKRRANLSGESARPARVVQSPWRHGIALARLREQRLSRRLRSCRRVVRYGSSQLASGQQGHLHLANQPRSGYLSERASAAPASNACLA